MSGNGNPGSVPVLAPTAASCMVPEPGRIPVEAGTAGNVACPPARYFVSAPCDVDASAHFFFGRGSEETVGHIGHRHFHSLAFKLYALNRIAAVTAVKGSHVDRQQQSENHTETKMSTHNKQKLAPPRYRKMNQKLTIPRNPRASRKGMFTLHSKVVLTRFP